MKTSVFLLGICFLAAGCTKHPGVDRELMQLQFKSPEGQPITVKNVTGKKGIVLLFYSPECPLCINYTSTLTEMQREYSDAGIGFLVVFPGTFYSAGAVDSFLQEYHLQLPVLMDPGNILVKALTATVTPEAALIDPSGQVIYHGAIDDWSYETGKKRPAAKNHYLKNALRDYVSGRKPSITYIEPVGCFIE
jgi:peroxiredoxin